MFASSVWMLELDNSGSHWQYSTQGAGGRVQFHSWRDFAAGPCHLLGTTGSCWPLCRKPGFSRLTGPCYPPSPTSPIEKRLYIQTILPKDLGFVPLCWKPFDIDQLHFFQRTNLFPSRTGWARYVFIGHSLEPNLT